MRAVSLLMLLATFSGTVRVRAADAEALVAEGVALRKDHKDLEALRLFRLAYAQAPSPRIRAQIGLAEQAVGKWIEAEADVSAALAAVSDPWIEKNGAVLRAALAAIREHLGWLELTGPEGAVVAVNGAPSGKLPLRRTEGSSVGWNHLVPIGGPTVLLYSTTRGSPVLGAGAVLYTKPRPGGGWMGDQVAAFFPGEFPWDDDDWTSIARTGDGHFLFYRRSDGHARLLHLAAGADLAATVSESKTDAAPGPGWTSIVSLR